MRSITIPVPIATVDPRTFQALGEWTFYRYMATLPLANMKRWGDSTDRLRELAVLHEAFAKARPGESVVIGNETHQALLEDAAAKPAGAELAVWAYQLLPFYDALLNAGDA